MATLLIVESPAKAKTINRYLGSGYIVEASLGHVRDLPKKDLAVDIESGFLPTYVPIDRKADVIERLRRLSRTADRVVLATDPDREGEAIAWHILQEIDDDSLEVSRVRFAEITRRGVEKGMADPRPLDLALVRAQEARRVMDRLIGYKVSPVLWNAFRGESHTGLSAGRVQSVALRLVVEREREINSFVPIEYWNLDATFAAPSGETFVARLVQVGQRNVIRPKGSALESKGKATWIDSESEAESIRDRALFEDYSIVKNDARSVKRRPPDPFTTSTLQQEASLRLKMKPKRTMQVAQKLYEGIALGKGGRTGLITYMRTDSIRVSDDAVSAAEEWIFENYGKEYLPTTKSKRSSGKGKENVQDAHEAIRPTDLSLTPKKIRKEMSGEEAELYELIYRRFIASRMADARFEQTTIDVRGGEFTFRATGRVPTFRGWLQVYDDLPTGGPGAGSKKKKDADPPDDAILPAGLDVGTDVDLQAIVLKATQTKPPPRYRESTLVKELETKGIGRPSTFAATVATILDRAYVEEKGERLYATELGMRVCAVLVENFPTIFDVKFTSRMEKDLDAIAVGTSEYLGVMKSFYKPFSSALKRARVAPVGKEDTSPPRRKRLTRTTRADERKRLDATAKRRLGTGEQECPKCGSRMEMREGKYGPFLACTSFPKCAYVQGMDQSTKSENSSGGSRPAGSEPGPTSTDTDTVPCPACSAPMVERRSKNGPFYGCSRYPECRRTMPIPSDVPCPACGVGSLVERRSKRGPFVGCNRYPECRYTAETMPTE